MSPSPNKHQSNSEVALISNKIENKREKTLFNIDFRVYLAENTKVNSMESIIELLHPSKTKRNLTN